MIIQLIIARLSSLPLVVLHATEVCFVLLYSIMPPRVVLSHHAGLAKEFLDGFLAAACEAEHRQIRSNPFPLPPLPDLPTSSSLVLVLLVVLMVIILIVDCNVVSSCREPILHEIRSDTIDGKPARKQM